MPCVPGHAQEVALLEIGYSRLERLENEAPLVRVRAAPGPPKSCHRALCHCHFGPMQSRGLLWV